MKGYFTGKPLPKNESDRLDYIYNNSIKIYDDIFEFKNIWKDRLKDIATVEKIRYKALEHNKLYIEKLKEICGEVEQLYHVQGYVNGKRYYLKAYSEKHSFQCITYTPVDYEEIVLTLDKDLPLYIGREDELSDSAKKLFLERLAGPNVSGNKFAVEATIRNDIIKRYIKIEHRIITYEKVMHICTTILKKYIMKKYHILL